MFVSSHAVATQPSFQGLGAQSRAWGISADGSTVVGQLIYWHDANGLSVPSYEAFRWQNGIMTGLGDLPGGDTDSGAYGVSADGSVVVGYGHDTNGESGFRWVNGVMSNLTESGAWKHSSAANGVSDDGLVVVGHVSDTDLWLNSSGNYAFRWDNGVMTMLDVQSSFRAQAVSGDGSTLVGWRTGSFLPTSFRWQNGIVTDLGIVAAFGLDRDGSVVVGAGENDALRWENGVATSLGQGMAIDCSGDGSVVVGTSLTIADLRWGGSAFIWTPELGRRDLLDFLTTDCGLDLSGWTLYEATGVSDDGRTICGYGVGPTGGSEAWIAHIPEPTSMAILVMGGTALSRRRRARGRHCRGRPKLGGVSASQTT